MAEEGLGEFRSVEAEVEVGVEDEGLEAEVRRLPVSEASLEFAASDSWRKYDIGRAFSAILYAALRKVGVGSDVAKEDIRRLLKIGYRIGMTPIQMKVAYAYEKGVIGRDKRFVGKTIAGIGWEARFLEARKTYGSRTKSSYDPEQWGDIQADGLKSARGKPDQAEVGVEFNWIRSNLFEWPDFGTAPSRGAIKTWLAVSMPGNEGLLNDFLREEWKKRLSPGDKVRKKVIFEADKEGEARAAGEGDEERYRRLFGGQGSCPSGG